MGKKSKSNQNYQNNQGNQNNLDKPLSEVYKDKKQIFLENGEAYKIANSMRNIKTHQLRKILNEVKNASMLCSQDKFNEARDKLYYVVPLTAYNAGRNKDLKTLYNFVKNHINDKTIQSSKDIEVLDQLFTSIIAYHKLLSKN